MRAVEEQSITHFIYHIEALVNGDIAEYTALFERPGGIGVQPLGIARAFFTRYDGWTGQA
jgi:hypothetical protein